MVTTVRDNSPQSINTSLFSLQKEIDELRRQIDRLNAEQRATINSANTWSSGKTGDRLTSKRVFPLYVDNDCKASDLVYFAMKNPDGWIDISLSRMSLRSSSIHNGDVIFKHKLGSYIQQMFPSGDPYRITGAIDRSPCRQNTGFDIGSDGMTRTYLADGVPIEPSGGFDDVTGLFGINFRIYAPGYVD